jgi:hypothetical protein
MPSTSPHVKTESIWFADIEFTYECAPLARNREFAPLPLERQKSLVHLRRKFLEQIRGCLQPQILSLISSGGL